MLPDVRVIIPNTINQIFLFILIIKVCLKFTKIRNKIKINFYQRNPKGKLDERGVKFENPLETLALNTTPNLVRRTAVESNCFAKLRFKIKFVYK